MILLWVLVIPALTLSVLAYRGEAARIRYIKRTLPEPDTGEFPPATVIVPVKGEDDGLKENLAALATLDYPDHELIVAARTPGDVPDGVLPPKAKVVYAGAAGEDSSEKIGNLLAAIAASRVESGIYAFADSDGCVPPGWLRALAAPLRRKEVGASTGYRWYIPRRPDFWSLLRGAWNAVIAGSFGPGPNGFLWGGAMAIRKQVFEEARVAEYWAGAVSDDYQLARAVLDAGLEIAYAPGAMVASLDRIGPRELFSWVRRQMVLTRVHAPRLWRTALLAHVIYCGAMVASAAAALAGWMPAILLLGAQIGLGVGKALVRSRTVRLCFPGYRDWFRRYAWMEVMLAPVATWLWLYSLLASTASNTIEWRGRTYRLERPPSRARLATLRTGCHNQTLRGCGKPNENAVD
ncbi:MAG: glycosyltransferase [Bryobacteraceae bacterium]|nr:glycosyltransferase family 2 protein [Bryobacterales bacterium]MEB2363335.1 glycosyltransferase family 2 protein [Bryobacterales bacterium]NUN04069.1 glycosyltransferase [Bryobacteraceae bacterium]